MTLPTLDQVILVDSHDTQIGVMDKVEAHRGEGHLHRASSVLLFNHQGEVLLQKRSAEKLVGAGQWANTCCGNVRPGESYEACAQRRLSEELGITDVELIPLTKFHYQVTCNQEFSENEIDQVYLGFYEGVVDPNPEEVAEVKWLPWSELLHEYKTQRLDSDNWVPWLALLLNSQIDVINKHVVTN